MPRKTGNQSGNSAYLKQIAAAMKALSNENRLAVFEQIRTGNGTGKLDADNQLTVCEVASNFDISLSTISHHIKELRSAGLITCERQGQTIR
ncbi:MAG TPA: metalloregulator ArsR/SmtB family transcription factor [Spirochaetota bacterium]|nr:metalloregulator ArsR/SmtB family transcription factor [Spirochaetota bacterium]HNT09498.1 metalloregulator ArsR/SmtB family transcription factor [Spirochaetota bacterium]HOS38790.1 metalloregulator ArsR/SmtB family transcription factor [Spirochaetota bacterium]